jgi:hypothetical protein
MFSPSTILSLLCLTPIYLGMKARIWKNDRTVTKGIFKRIGDFDELENDLAAQTFMGLWGYGVMRAMGLWGYGVMRI